jgi:hypothetical protein
VPGGVLFVIVIDEEEKFEKHCRTRTRKCIFYFKMWNINFTSDLTDGYNNFLSLPFACNVMSLKVGFVTLYI